MKKYKVSEIIKAKEALSSILNEKMPAKLSWEVVSLNDEINPIFERFKTQVKTLFESSEAKITDSKQLTYEFPDRGKLEAFNKELEELNNIEEDIKGQISNINDLNISISPEDLKALQLFFKE